MLFVTEYLRMDIPYKAVLSDLDLVAEKGREEMLGWYSSLSCRIVSWLETGLSYSEFYINRAENHFIYGNNQVMSQYMNYDIPDGYEKKRWCMYSFKLSYVF